MTETECKIALKNAFIKAFSNEYSRSRLDQERHAGYIEALLTFLGVIKLGETFIYLEKEVPGFFWGTSKRQEVYAEMIFRKAYHYMRTNGVHDGTKYII